MRSNILIKDFLQRFLAKQLKNIPYKFRINSDDPMIDFWPKAIFHQRFPSKISCARANPKKIPFSETVNYNAWCELALSKKQEQSSRNLFSLSKISNSISCKNWKSWCQWPAPWHLFLSTRWIAAKTYDRMPQKLQMDYIKNLE